MNIKFLESAFGNDPGDIVEILEITDNEIYYDDGFGRYCYLEKSEENKAFVYTSDPITSIDYGKPHHRRGGGVENMKSGCTYPGHENGRLVSTISFCHYEDSDNNIKPGHVCNKCYAKHILKFYPDSKIAQHIRENPAEYKNHYN